MKNLDPNITNHLLGDVTTLALCWKLTLKNGTILTFTDHDVDLLFDALTYKATTGFSSSGVPSNVDMKVNSIDVQSFIDDVYIKEEDLLAGIYDNARVEVFRVNWANPSDGAIVLQVGRIGDIDIQGQVFVAEVRGRLQFLKKNAGKVYSPNCRADLGDSDCGINLGTYEHTGSVVGVTDNRTFTTSALGEADNYFARGIIEWTSGGNNGLRMEVKSNVSTTLTLILNALFAVQVSDTFKIYPGCNKSSTTCKNTYSNLVNFRGEPFIPSMTTTISPRAT